MSENDKKGLVIKYFVLSPLKDTPYGDASRQAMLTYANMIESTNPLLANDLREWVSRIKHQIKRDLT